MFYLGGVEKHEKMDGYLDVVFDVLGEDQEVTLSETEDYLAEIDPKAKIVEIFISEINVDHHFKSNERSENSYIGLADFFSGKILKVCSRSISFFAV